MKEHDQHFKRSIAMRTISFFTVAMTMFAIGMGCAHNGSRIAMSRNQALNGAFTDGAYLGSLAAQRGETPHIASGRWTGDSNRKSFLDGYMSGYNQTIVLMTATRPTNQNNQAAYRDGAYLGKLDAEQGRAEHIASGRWAQIPDRESFGAGYREAYSDEVAARIGKTKGTAQAFLVR
jgi:hypothetical protein